LYIAMPIVAAVIGYFTNWVAIWMLFRPYNEKRILGIKLPFTPGLIPARRTEMAERMGLAISKHLINEQSIQDRLDTPEIRERISTAITGYSEELLSRDLGSVNSMIPASFERDWRSFLRSIKSEIRNRIEIFLKSDQIEELVAKHVHAQLDHWMNEPIESLASREFLESAPKRAMGVYEKIVRGEGFERGLRRVIENRSTALQATDQTLGEIVPDSLRSAAYERLSVILPIFTSQLVAMLEDENLKNRIKVSIYELVDDILSQTFRENSKWDQFRFGLMETFFISVEEIKAKVDYSVEEAVPKISELVTTQDVEQKIFQAVRRGIDDLLARPISELRLSERSGSDLYASASDLILTSLRSDHTSQRLESLIEDELATNKSKSLNELVGDVVEPAEIEEVLTRRITAWLRQESTHDQVMAQISDQIDQFLDRPIGVLNERISHETKTKIIDWLSERGVGLLKRETPKILSAVNVEGLVRDQVNKLPIDEVERLILAITSRQLKAITWFGALLGFTIGLIQVVVVILTGGLGE